MSGLTVAALIGQSAERLAQAPVAFGHGTQSAFDEAVWLVLWRLGMPLDSDLDEVGHQAVKPEQQAACTALIGERIATRKPAATSRKRPGCRACPFTSTSAPSCRAA